mgnify:CR=1 FL=1
MTKVIEAIRAVLTSLHRDSYYESDSGEWVIELSDADVELGMLIEQLEQGKHTGEDS